MSSLPDAKPVNSLSEEPIGTSQRNAPPPDASVWQRDLANAVQTIPELLAAVDLAAEDVPEVSETARQSFRLLVPQSFLKRMQSGNPHDPLLLQVLPRGAELDVAPGFVADPVGDSDARQAPGLLQKYHGRALLIASGSCAVHCRYCFRREYPYSEAPRRLTDWEPALRELRQREDITEVILSGGDPLMLPDDRLAWLMDRLDAISHVERLRLHTRLPVVLPTRVSDQLVELLLKLRAQVVFVIHANHANEIRGDARAALRRLVTSGLPVLNQAVLLKGINDSVDDQEALNRALINTGVIPYYLHQLDRVTGTGHFEVPVPRARQIIEELRTRLPGYAVPRLVQEIPGRDSKTPLEIRDAAR